MPDVLYRPNVPFGTGRLAGVMWFGVEKNLNSSFKGGTNNWGRSTNSRWTFKTITDHVFVYKDLGPKRLLKMNSL